MLNEMTLGHHMLPKENISTLNDSIFETIGDFDFRVINNSSNLCNNCRLIFASIWSFLIISGLLAITDVAFIISCVPFTTYSYLIENWTFGNFICKTYHYFSFVTVCATCLTLMMMTIDRCFYICNSQTKSWRNSVFVFYISCLIWLVSFILSIPNLITYNVQTLFYLRDQNSTFIYYETLEECVQKPNYFWSNFTQWYSTIVSYLLPSVVLVISYIKILHYMTTRAKSLAQRSVYNGKVSMYRKRKVTKFVIILTLTFMVLWFPVHFLATWYRLDKDFPEHFSFYIFKMIAHTMSYANSTLNPIIYAFSNESFRHNIIHLFRRVFRRKDYGTINNKQIRANKEKSVNELTAFL